MIAKNVFDGAKRRLVTPIEKKEAITPDMLLKLYNSVFRYDWFVLKKINKCNMKRISWEYIQHVNTIRNSFFQRMNPA
jgi:hypothetical protein